MVDRFTVRHAGYDSTDRLRVIPQGNNPPGAILRLLLSSP
jgi:hypothetical protein